MIWTRVKKTILTIKKIPQKIRFTNKFRIKFSQFCHINSYLIAFERIISVSCCNSALSCILQYRGLVFSVMSPVSNVQYPVCPMSNTQYPVFTVQCWSSVSYIQCLSVQCPVSSVEVQCPVLKFNVQCWSSKFMSNV